ncbi:MAG: RNA polymerase sigma factor [Myxococcota bacterium]|nr:RNA polymerase sigma factor [Myxococcota bacterium]
MSVSFSSATSLQLPRTFLGLLNSTPLRVTPPRETCALARPGDAGGDSAGRPDTRPAPESFATARSLELVPSVAPPPPSTTRLVINGETSDEELALAACGGDPRAPVAIWRRYGVQVRSKLLRWTGFHDVDDHVQEVFSRLFEQLPRLRQPSALRSFLIGITLRVACTELRRRRRWRLRLTATGEVPEVADYDGDDGAAREALTRFEGILGKLAPRTRRVFVLRYVEKLELVDVAAAMHISLATAKRHLARASSRVFAMVKREPALAEYIRDLKARAYVPAPALAAS